MGWWIITSEESSRADEKEQTPIYKQNIDLSKRHKEKVELTNISLSTNKSEGLDYKKKDEISRKPEDVFLNDSNNEVKKIKVQEADSNDENCIEEILEDIGDEYEEEEREVGIGL